MSGHWTTRYDRLQNMARQLQISIRAGYYTAIIWPH